MADPREVLRIQAGGNFLYIIISTLGLIGNGLVLYIYTKYRRQIFKFKSFHLLRNLAVADILTCLGSFIWGTIRFTEFIFNLNPTTGSLECQGMSFIYHLGYKVSTTIDFTIAIDRLIFLANPKYHRSLGCRYISFLILIGWLRPVIEVCQFFWGLSDQPVVTVCTAVHPVMMDISKPGNLASFISNKMDISLVLGTIVLYICCIFAGRRTLNRTILQIVRGDFGSENLHLKTRLCIAEQQQLFRLSIVIAASFAFSTLLGYTILALWEQLSWNIGVAPYVGTLILLSSADTILIAIWRDKTFREKLKINLQELLHRLKGKMSADSNREDYSLSVIDVHF